MTSPLEASVAAVGFTVPALHITRLLLDDMKAIHTAPKDIEQLRNELDAVSEAHKSIKAIPARSWDYLGGNVADMIEVEIQKCEKSSATLREDLKRWTRHSHNGKLSFLDRANVGFFKQRQMKAMLDQLAVIKLNFSFTVGIAGLYSSFRNNNVTEEMRRSVCRMEANIQRAQGSTEGFLSHLHDCMASLQLHPATPDEPDEEIDRASALRQVEEKEAALRAALSTIDELLPKAEEKSIREAVKTEAGTNNVNFGDHNHGVMIGVNYAQMSGFSVGK